MNRLITLLLLGVVAGCAPEAPLDRDIDPSRPAAFGFNRNAHDALVADGERTYTQYCVGCHGVVGDGKGDAAKFLDPRPRDFVTASFKFASTRSGQLPTDDDLARTIRNGLRGSAMPPFEFFDARRIEGLIEYIKTFSPRWKQSDLADQIPRVEDPYRALADRADAINRGRLVYHGLTRCFSCHPAYAEEVEINQAIVAFGGAPIEGFRPNLFDSEGKPNVEGYMVYPPDFRRDFVRAGASVNDLYRSIAAGISGTAMPTWVGYIHMESKEPGGEPLATNADLWALAYYVQSLILEKAARFAPEDVVVRDRPRPIYLHGEPPKVTEEEPGDVPFDDSEFDDF